MIVFRNLGKALRRLREEKGQSQKQTAEAAGITPPMLSAYENDRTSPEIETLDKILDGLGSSLSDLEMALLQVNGGTAPSRPTPTSAPTLLHSQTVAALEQFALRGSDRQDPLPREMEEGYAEIVRGLLRVSRFVFESVAHRHPADAGRSARGE